MLIKIKTLEISKNIFLDRSSDVSLAFVSHSGSHHNFCLIRTEEVDERKIIESNIQNVFILVQC